MQNSGSKRELELEKKRNRMRETRERERIVRENRKEYFLLVNEKKKLERAE